jgi:DNA-binding transcriptional LysR family regulator
MNYRHLEVFYAVMTHGTATEAARQLGVSQPSVTTTLQQAEQQLQIQLFQRAGGRLVPTVEARQLFEEAQRAHEALESFQLVARRLRHGLGGQFRIVAIPLMSLQLLPDAIATYSAQKPEYSFSSNTLNTEEMLQRLDARAGSFHVGFTLGELSESHVNLEQIGSTELLVVLPASWQLEQEGPLDLCELEDRPFLGGSAATPLGLACNRLFHDTGISPRVVAQSHSHYINGCLAQRGMGYTIVDAITARALLNSPLAASAKVRVIRSRPTIPLTAIFPGQRNLHAAARPFAECLKSLHAKHEHTLIKAIT